MGWRIVASFVINMTDISMDPKHVDDERKKRGSTRRGSLQCDFEHVEMAEPLPKQWRSGVLYLV